VAGTGEPVAGWLARIVRLHDDIIVSSSPFAPPNRPRSLSVISQFERGPAEDSAIRQG
jgi:hypothetical protein